MYQKTVLETLPELLAASNKTRAAGDEGPYITGKLVISGNYAKLEDTRIEWSGDARSVIAAALEACGFEVEWK